MKPTYEELQIQLVAVVAENAALKSIIEAVQGVANQSQGITGWHLNGAVAEWDEVLPEINNVKTPATDAYMAEVRLQARNEGINYAASRLAAAFNHGFVDKPLAEVYDVVRMILTAKEDLANDPAADGLSGEYAEKSLAEFAAQLRQGVGK